MRVAVWYKMHKKYVQAAYSGLYALLAFYILLNTSFLQLSIFNYIRHSTDAFTAARPQPVVALRQSLIHPHHPAPNALTAPEQRSLVKLNETVLWMATSLTHLFFTDKFRPARITIPEQESPAFIPGSSHLTAFHFTRCLRAPPVFVPSFV